ncbi:hypothetical protein [Asticcacaulis sp.]|mgnify:CR=1 FL=1|uniref:hypothetical protein n=1 Tax=Asticcacaulis sp. TaxID=1872648 RepID=UPI003F7B9AB9
MTQLFLEHKVYKPKADGVQIYICQEKIGRNLFAVQLSTFANEDNAVAAMDQHNHYQADMLVSFISNPDIEWFATVEEAIAAHDEDFN